MSTRVQSAVAVEDKSKTNLAIGRMLLFGQSAGEMAGELGCDFDTARKNIQAVKGQWAGELADPQALRSLLAGMAWSVWSRATEWADTGGERSRAPLLRVGVSAIQAMLDISGLRMLRVDVGSSQLAGLLAQMAGTAGLAALSSGDRAAVAGEWREVVAGESGGDGDRET